MAEEGELGLPWRSTQQGQGRASLEDPPCSFDGSGHQREDRNSEDQEGLRPGLGSPDSGMVPALPPSAM